MKITGLITIATLSVTVAAGAAVADTASVSRCNFTEGATYKPGLWITRDGVRRLVKVDEEGLTRRIIFDDQLAMDYVRAQMGADVGASHVSITNACSESTYSYSAEAAPVVKETTIIACGLDGCGPTDCGPTDCGPTDCGPTECGPATTTTSSD